MGVFREGTHPAWAVFMSVYLLGAFVLAGYWWITGSGAVGWLAEWQADALFDGGWYPATTFLVVLCGLLLPLGVIKRVYEWISGKQLFRPISRDDLDL